jgi:hypothetical protein
MVETSLIKIGWKVLLSGHKNVVVTHYVNDVRCLCYKWSQLCFQRDRAFWEHEGRQAGSQACLFCMLQRQECNDGPASRLFWRGTLRLVAWHVSARNSFGVACAKCGRGERKAESNIVLSGYKHWEVKLSEEKLVGVWKSLSLSVCVPFPAVGNFSRVRAICNLNRWFTLACIFRRLVELVSSH